MSIFGQGDRINPPINRPIIITADLKKGVFLMKMDLPSNNNRKRQNKSQKKEAKTQLLPFLKSNFKLNLKRATASLLERDFKEKKQFSRIFCIELVSDLKLSQCFINRKGSRNHSQQKRGIKL